MVNPIDIVNDSSNAEWLMSIYDLDKKIRLYKKSIIERTDYSDVYYKKEISRLFYKAQRSISELEKFLYNDDELESFRQNVLTPFHDYKIAYQNFINQEKNYEI